MDFTSDEDFSDNSLDEDSTDTKPSLDQKQAKKILESIHQRRSLKSTRRKRTSKSPNPKRLHCAQPAVGNHKLLLLPMTKYYEQVRDPKGPYFIRKYLEKNVITTTDRILDYIKRFVTGVGNFVLMPDVTIMDVLIECVRVGKERAKPIIEEHVQLKDDEKQLIREIMQGKFNSQDTEEDTKEIAWQDTDNAWFIEICLLLALPRMQEKVDLEKQEQSGYGKKLTLFVTSYPLNGALKIIVRSSGIAQAFVNPKAVLAEILRQNNWSGPLSPVQQATAYIDAADYFDTYIYYASVYISTFLVGHVSQWLWPSELKQLTSKLQRKRRYQTLENGVSVALLVGFLEVLRNPKLRNWLYKHFESFAGRTLRELTTAADTIALKVGLQQEVSTLNQEQLKQLDNELKQINPNVLSALQRWVRNNLPSILALFPKPEQDQDDDNKNA